MLDRIRATLRELRDGEVAATMLEYALLICLCALICLATIGKIGTKAAVPFNSAAGSLTKSSPPGCQNSNGSAADKNPNC